MNFPDQNFTTYLVPGVLDKVLLICLEGKIIFRVGFLI